MRITKRFYDKTSKGIPIDIYTLSNSKGMVAEVINFGATLVSLKVPDKKGRLDDVVLGYDNLADYEKSQHCFGGIIGRCANIIGGATIEIDDVKYKLDKNEGENHLNGGFVGFHKVVWNAEVVWNNGQDALALTYTSEDGEGGYPGKLDVTVIYSLTDNNELVISYHGTLDKDTIVNMTNQSYFNLAGRSSGSILKHKLWINGDKFIPINSNKIPTGEIQDVIGTPMDFTSPKAIGRDLESDFEQIAITKGYNHTWVLNTYGSLSEKLTELVDESSGRVMEVYTTKPGVQFGNGNFIDDDSRDRKSQYSKYSGLCLATQFFPDAVNNKNFPCPILRVGEEYKHTIIYKFI